LDENLANPNVHMSWNCTHSDGAVIVLVGVKRVKRKMAMLGARDLKMS